MKVTERRPRALEVGEERHEQVGRRRMTVCPVVGV